MAEKLTQFTPVLKSLGRGMAYLLAQVEQQRAQLQELRVVLPPELGMSVKHCLVKEHKLVIYTDSAVWASQLRFYRQTLLAAIAPLTTQTVTQMQVKVLLEAGRGGEKMGRKAKLPSPKTIEVIRNQSAAVSDEQLKLALLKLSETLKQGSES